MLQANIESYPPIFRLSSTNLTRKPEPEKLATLLDPLPIIDMECLDVEKLDKSCREYGIFRLENHGVPTSLLIQLQEHAKNVFKLPFETKQDLSSNSSISSSSGCPIKYFWGTPALNSSGVALQRANDALNMDWVEGFNVPVSQLHPHYQLIHHHHLPLINDFRGLLGEYSWHLRRIASTLFEAMIRNLKLNLEEVKACLDESSGLIRVYRYPRQCISEHVNGLHEHTDSSVISILSQDQVGGLKFFKDDMWFKVTPIPNTLLVNLGDMMQVLSDDKYKSVKHKVELNESKDRLSICYFVFPEDNTLIQSSNYRPFTYHDFRAQVQQDLKTHGWKIGLQHFKLQQII